jgi:hypothetical protein
MANQLVISSGAKVRNLSGVLTGTSGVVNSLGINVPDGIPQLDGSGKILVSQLPNSVMEYKGTWNASTNTPTLANGTGNAGDVYLCNVAGTVNFGAGPITFAVGDQVLYSGTTWERASGATGTVTSVAVTESGDALTITGSPITTSGTINIGFAGTTGQYINGAGGLTTFPSLTGYVPYTGATANVALGEFGLSGGYIGLDTTPTSTPTSVGTLSWDSAYLTPKVVTGTGNTTLQIGQEEVILIHNNTGSTLTDGQVVYVTGSTGELPSVSLADASSETTSAATLGVITETIANGSNGFATVSGIVHGLNTLAYNEGDLLWLSETAGQFTNVKPVSPAHLVLIGYVIKKAGGNGSILVKIQNTQELEECSDVLFTSLANNDILAYESSTDLWKNKTIANVLGYTPANDSLVVHLAGTETITGAKTFSQDILVNSVKVGKGAGTGTNNIAIGDNVLTDNTTGYANLAIGSYALWHNTVGFGNIALGRESLIAATTGSLNIAIGDNTMKGVVTGGQNIAIGANTAQNATSGSSNTLIGYSVGNALTTGSNNIFIGFSSGSTVSTGNYNTIIGGFPSFSSSSSMSNNIILADGQGNIRYRWDGTQTLINGVALGSNAFTSTSYLPLTGGTLTGALSGTSATFSGSVGIGTSSPYSTLHVNQNNTSATLITVGNNNGGNIFGVNASGEGLISTYANGDLIFGRNYNSSFAETMRIKNNGNVGIGTSSPLSFTSYTTTQTSNTAGALMLVESTAGSILGQLVADNGFGGGAAVVLGARSNHPVVFTTNNTERMRITSGGDKIMKGSVSDITFTGDGVQMNFGRNEANYIQANGGTSSNIRVIANTNGVVLSNGATSWGSLSDENIKDIIEPIDNATNKISTLRAIIGKYKTDSEDKRRLFLIAQDVEKVFPEATFSILNEDNTENLGLNYQDLIPVLVKAIQELSQELNELKAKIK